MWKYGVILTAVWLAMASDITAAQSPTSEINLQKPEPLTTTDAVVNIEDVNFFRRTALVLQMILTPSRLADEVAPLYAYSKDTVCNADETIWEDDGDSYGPAAVVRAEGALFSATYYPSTETAFWALAGDSDGRDKWCDQVHVQGEYLATTFRVPLKEPNLHLLMTDAARLLPGWSQDPNQR